MMAASDKTLRYQMSQSALRNNNNDGLNDSPYNSFSSFKSFDNTVVSAYEVGIANGLSGKSAKNTRNRDLPVPRVRKSLARKPPSGAKLEYKPSGTVTKSKSLTEINTINNGSYKIPDRNAERFDNRSYGHPEQTSKNYCVPAGSSDHIHAGNRYSKHITNHQGTTMLHAQDDYQVSTTCFVGDKSFLNAGITCHSDENKTTHRRSDGLEVLTVRNGEGLDSSEDTKNHLHQGDNTSVILKDTIGRQSVQCKPEGSLNGTHDSSKSFSHDFNRKGNNYRLFQRQGGSSALLTKARKVNGNISGSGRRRSLNDGIELFSSNLVHDDPVNLHGSQLDKTAAGKQNFRNQHHSSKHHPNTDENTEAVPPHTNNTISVAGNESEIPRTESQSGLSRRKLPKVPDQTAMSVNKMAEKVDKGKPGVFNDSDSVISETIGGKQLEQHKDGAVSTTIPKGRIQNSNTFESNFFVVESSGLDTNIAPKLPESEMDCDKRVLSRTNPPKGSSSRKGSLKEQIMEWKRDSAETQQSVALNKSVDENALARSHVNNVRGRRSGRTRTKPNVSGNIEDKFRNKLKEIVASGSTNNEKKSKTAERKKVNNTHDIHHAHSDEQVLETVSCSAITDSDVRFETSPKPNGAKQEIQITDSLNTSNESNVSELPANSVFSFNQCVIQELTDLVMTKPAIALTDHDVLDQDPPKMTQDSVEGMIAVSDCNSRISDINDIVSETQSEGMNMVSSDLSGRSGSSENEHKSLDSSFDQKFQSLISSEDLNQSQKLHIEGKSFNGKTEIINKILATDDVCKETVDLDANTSAETKQSNEEKMQRSVKEITTKTQKDFSQKSGHVLRTPSYRKKVMARAKLRYSKKSQNFKECSCVKKENGELVQCSFCQMFEMKKRSQTSLGHSALGEFSDGECSDISSPRRALTPEMTSSRSSDKGHNSPRSVRKVNVSPRVDVLLSSNLFKKHLQKHENLIHKHTMSYKRFGMNKSVSNLDLSEGFTTDTESSYVDNASEMSEPAALNDFTDDAQDRSTDFCKLSDESPNRRHSLTSGSDIYLADVNHKAIMRKKSGDTLPSSFTKPRSRPGLGGLFDNVRNRTASRNNIPSFHEFRKRKEKESSTGNHGNEHLSLDGKSAGVDDVTDNVSTALKGQGHDCENINHDLQTVLETDEKGSKENLINAVDVTNEDCKLISGSKVQLLGSENQVHDRQGLSEVVITGVEYSGDNIPNSSGPEKPQPALKTKSRTLPSLDSSVMSDNSSDQSSSQSVREKRRISGKRPRSVMSKKSHPDSDTPDTSEKETSIRQNVSARPKLKGHGKKILRSESDSKYETEKGKNPNDIEDLKTKGVHSRHLSLLGKGHNSVTFNLDSTQNDGASDVSSSITESLMSDSMYSESYVNETVPSLYDTDDFTDGSNNDVSAALKDDLATSVLRSTSDACETTHEAARKRRERKERPYKSDPFSGTEIIPAAGRCAIREEKARLMREHLSFSTSSKEEILSFLDGVSQSDLERGHSFPSLEEISEDDLKSDAERQAKFDMMRKLGKHPSNVSSLSTDSGVVGQDDSHDSKQSSPTSTLTHSVSEHSADWHQSQQFRKGSLSASCGNLSSSKNRGCIDCNKDSQHPNLTNFNCLQCEQRQIERKKIIQEVMDTEVNYGRDLKILLEEFYKPMLKAGLLTKDQLDRIFLNIDELIHVNVHFITKLKAAINYSNLHNDEDLNEVMIGSLFLESSTMFLTFENYCVNQAQAPILLEQLEREKELLRIFLHVSQSENHLLRRMHLKSFLMVPVQRIMKYPLLLDRLYKVTLDKHKDKEALREAKEKIEDILGHINAKSKSSSIKQRKGSEKHYSVTEKIEVSRVALETLGWNRKDVCDVITTRLHVTQPLDHMWAVKKCKNYKFTTMHGVLLSLVQPNFSGRDKENISDNATHNSSIHSHNNNNNNNNNLKNNNNLSNTSNASAHVVSAAVVLIKEKNGRYQVAREPFMLEKCVVSQDLDFMEVFELLEWNRESYLIKAESPMETKTWVQYLRQQMQNLGCWRKRRNALPNILLNHLS